MNEWMDAVPSVQKRLATRRMGNTIEDGDQDALARVHGFKSSHSHMHSDSDSSCSNEEDDNNDDINPTINVDSNNKVPTNDKQNLMEDGVDDNQNVAVNNEGLAKDLNNLTDHMLINRYKDRQSHSGGRDAHRSSWLLANVDKELLSDMAAANNTDVDGKKKINRRQSVLFNTSCLSIVNTFSDKSKKYKDRNSDHTAAEQPIKSAQMQETNCLDNVRIPRPHNLGNTVSGLTTIDALSEEVTVTNANNDPYADEFDETKYDVDWNAFQEQLARVNEHDKAMQRIAAAEQARRDEEARKQNEDALRFKQAREQAEADEAAIQLAREETIVEDASNSLKAILGEVSLDRELVNTPHSPVIDSSQPRSFIKGDIKDGEEAVDEGSQFDITFAERYEMDSMFDASAAATVASEMTPTELVYAAANAATIMQNKIREEAELAATASARALDVTASFEGFDELQELKKLKRAQERAMLRQEMDTVMGGSSKVSISRLDKIHKEQMASRMKELKDQAKKVEKDRRKREEMDSAVSVAETKSCEAQSRFGRSRTDDLFTNSRSVSPGSIRKSRPGSAGNSIVSQITGDHFSIVGDNSIAVDNDVHSVMSLENSDVFELTGTKGTAENFGVSAQGSSIIENYASGLYNNDRHAHSMEAGIVDDLPRVDKQFRFPHRAFSTIVSKTSVSAGNLGTWNHKRAVEMNLLVRKK